MMQSSEGAWVDPVEGIMYEHMLLLRVATQGVAPYGRSSALERSATVLLARLDAGGAMSVAELAEAFKPVAEALEAKAGEIEQALLDVQGSPVDLGGYYAPNEEKLAEVMRPVAAFNEIIDGLKK